jgi:LPS-assembly protein
MTVKKVCVIAILVGWVMLWARVSAQAQTAPGGGQSDGQKIDVTADQLSVGDGGTQIEAKGDVVIKRQETTLKAEEVRVNRVTQDVEAKGKVSVDDPEWKVKSAESMQFNMEKEAGEIQKGDLFIEQGHVSIMGERLQKFTGQTYHVDEGFFTTCLCESGPPSWQFSAEQVDLTPGGMGIIRNGYFYVMGVPIFYVPYGFFPLRTERQTGFLFPKFGHSTTEGFRFQQPFFWAISKSTDATLSFDIETNARVGALGEFRTVFNRTSDFQLDTSYFNESWRSNPQDDVVDRTIADQNIPQNRWNVFGTHRYTLPSNWLTYSDFAAYSDDLFTRELSDRFDLPRTRESDVKQSRYGRSEWGVYRGWRDTGFKANWDFYQDFIQYDAITLQRTPQISFWGRHFLSGFPVEFRWNAEGVNYIRRRGGDGLRLDLSPEVVLPFRMSSYLFGALSVAPRETLYHLYTPVTSERNISRELVEIRGNVGTSLSRVFAWKALGFVGLKHVMEPELSYLFVPSTNQSSIPIMDTVDRINRRNVLTFTLANRLWGKYINPLAFAGAKDVELLNAVGTGEIRELAALKLSLSYDIDKERKGGDTLSDVDIHLKVSPTGYLTAEFNGGVDPGPWQFTQARATFALSDPRPLPRRSLDPDFNRPNSIAVGYSFLRSTPFFPFGQNGLLAENANLDLNEPPKCPDSQDPRCTGFNKNIVGNLGVNTLYHATNNILLSFSSNYDVRDSRFLGVHAATKILSSCECWSVTFGVSHDINPSKTSFNFDFNLLGLGSTQSTLR